MTINESINQIIDSLMGKKANLLNHSDRVALTDALNIMRKYQKIVGIVSLDDEEFKQCGLKELKEILEVIADGKID